MSGVNTIPGEQYNWAREVKLNEHRWIARSVNESIELPKITIDNGIQTPSAKEAIIANSK